MMQISSILWTSWVLLALAASGGLVMAAIAWSGDRSPPTWLAMGHGFLGAAALTLLMYAAAALGLPTLALVALVLLLAAAAGGTLLNLKYHWNRLPLPRWLMATHAVVAAAGFVLLLMAAIRA